MTDKRRHLLTASSLAVFVLALVQPALSAWRATGPFGGEAGLVRVIPKDKGAVIAGTRVGLLFVSANGGASWTNLHFPAEFAGTLHALEVDPRSSGVWYAGMEGDHPWTSGVFKTTDAGHSWELLPATKGFAVWSLALYPANPDTIAAGTADGVYLSKNGGANWARISPAGDPELRPVVSLAFHPSNDAILYAGTTHLPWATTNGGASWQSIHNGMLDDSDVFSIQVDPRDPSRVFSSACSGVYGSTDAAANWKRFPTPSGAFRTHFVAELSIANDTRRGRVLFAGTTEGLLKSDTGGQTWRKVSPLSVKSAAFDPWVPGRVFFASTSGGVLLSVDGGSTLRESNFGFADRNFTALAGAGDALYASTVYEPGGEGVYRTDSQALRWARAGVPANDQIVLLACVPGRALSDAHTLFAAGYHSLMKSTDSGKTWAEQPSPQPGSRVTALTALEGNVVLAGTDQGLYRSTGAANWTLVAPGPVRALQSRSAITASGALASDDRGATWRTCANPAGQWTALAFEPGSGAAALAATTSGLFRSTDGCRSWTAVHDGLRDGTVSIVLFHPTRAGEAFATQAGAVFHSTDGGLHWSPVEDDGHHDFYPTSLFVLPAAPDRLFALLPRRGVYSVLIPVHAALERNSGTHSPTQQREETIHVAHN